jgi:flagellar biosynthetic protein FlhB
VLDDPIFNAPVDIKRIGTFLSESTMRIGSRVLLAMILIAAIDYAYQLWKTQRDLMMTKEEVKREHKEDECDPMIRGRRRRKQ